jgi:hypothetical protein
MMRITTATALSASDSWSYGYDALNRLTSASNIGDAAQSQSFVYDLAGNLTAGPLGSYTYPSATAARPHAVSAVGGQPIGYDAAGNMTSGLGRTLDWDGENRPSAIAKDGRSTGFVYGPDGERLIKAVTGTADPACAAAPPAEVTLTLSADLERTTRYACVGGAWQATVAWAKYPHPDFRVVGSGAAAATYFMHRDHLASVKAETDRDGALAQSSLYKPYGDRIETKLIAATPSDPKGFTGERHDAETGLIYLHARYSVTLRRRPQVT